MRSLPNGTRRATTLLLALLVVGAIAAGSPAADTRTDHAALVALRARSDALNRAYRLGVASTGSVAAAAAALAARSGEMNAKYHLGAYAIAHPTTRFNWTDAAVGAAGMLGILLAAGGVALGIRRTRGVEHVAAPTS